MSDKKIDKAISEALSSLGVENMNLTKDELDLIKKALQNKSKPDALLQELIKLNKENKEKKK